MNKKFTDVYQFDDGVPVVGKSVDASWLNQVKVITSPFPEVHIYMLILILRYASSL